MNIIKKFSRHACYRRVLDLDRFRFLFFSLPALPPPCGRAPLIMFGIREDSEDTGFNPLIKLFTSELPIGWKVGRVAGGRGTSMCGFGAGF